MKTIYKYPLGITDIQRIQMPERAEHLCVQVQKGEVCLWVLVDPKNKLESRVIQIHGTGNPIEYFLGEYVGTVQTHNGELIWHVFID